MSVKPTYSFFGFLPVTPHIGDIVANIVIIALLESQVVPVIPVKRHCVFIEPQSFNHLNCVLSNFIGYMGAYAMQPCRNVKCPLWDLRLKA